MTLIPMYLSLTKSSDKKTSNQPKAEPVRYKRVSVRLERLN